MTTVLCDLDGVLYRGSEPIAGVSEALEKLLASVESVQFITNNSTRNPEQAAEKITRLTGVEVEPEQVITSGQAAVGLLDPSDAPILVVGEHGLRDTVEAAGLTLTEDPETARAVVVGLTRSFGYQTIHDAMRAISNGARFVATNDDTTYPTEDGLAPGCGAIVAAIAAASGTIPEVAGKPNIAMRRLIGARVDGEVWVIGDRLDTDIALADHEPDWRSVLVLTGITSPKSAEGSSADYVVEDFPAAVDLVLQHLVTS